MVPARIAVPPFCLVRVVTPEPIAPESSMLAVAPVLPRISPVEVVLLMPPVSVKTAASELIRTPVSGLSIVMAPPKVFAPAELLSVPNVEKPSPNKVTGSLDILIDPPPMLLLNSS